MNLKQIYEQCKTLQESRKLIFCDALTQEGFVFENLKDFEKYIKKEKSNLYIFKEIANQNMRIFDFFQMQKNNNPYLVIMKHPLFTNGYLKNIPDEILDSYVSEQGYVYRYSYVEYFSGIDEYIIELPQTMDNKIFYYLRKKLGKNFIKNNYKNTSLSLIFTNTNRYSLFSEKNFITLPYNELYPDLTSDYTSENVSKELWDNIIEMDEK